MNRCISLLILSFFSQFPYSYHHFPRWDEDRFAKKYSSEMLKLLGILNLSSGITLHLSELYAIRLVPFEMPFRSLAMKTAPTFDFLPPCYALSLVDGLSAIFFLLSFDLFFPPITPAESTAFDDRHTFWDLSSNLFQGFQSYLFHAVCWFQVREFV